ncbi:MAG TPA: M1 family metallopeptidase, partial [Cytophagaceae bacterium]
MLRIIILLIALSTSLYSYGQNYWQQRVNYTISVKLDDQNHSLKGYEEVQYINNSPDRIHFIYFHLWPNAYKNDATPFARQQDHSKEKPFLFSKDNVRGYIDSLDFKVDGFKVETRFEDGIIDIVRVFLPKPLDPGDTAIITTPFYVKLPNTFSRLGHAGQSYQISQWYPKPAVYDRKGWHPISYLDQGEFYSEFGKFDVSITLPENYIVGATGQLQNPEELEWLNQLDSITRTKSFKSQPPRPVPPSSSKYKTLRYVQDSIHDFAWFADKRFNVVKGEVTLPHSARKVTTWQLFLDENALAWHRHRNDINDAVYYYSLWVGDYPYTQITAVDGALSAGSGMEYPMVTVTIPEAIIHEVGHNWFYGILASNEREYAWLDEGVNSYIENRIAEMRDPEEGTLSFLTKSPLFRNLLDLHDIKASQLNNLGYQMAASRGKDQPCELHSKYYTKNNYGTIVYMKTSEMMKYLAAYLGQKRFDAAMQQYYEQWKFKHPYPEDMQQVFEEVTGENLDWFFKGLIQTTEKLNISIKHINTTDSVITVDVVNKTAFPLPIPVSYVIDTTVIATIWTKPLAGDTTIQFKRLAKKGKIIADHTYLIPELNRDNNQIRLTGIFKSWKSIELQPFASIEKNSVKYLHYFPVAGANTTDKFMLGMAFYNSSLIQRKLWYFAMPMYSFHQNEINGIYSLSLSITPKGYAFSEIRLSGLIQKFASYTKYNPQLTLFHKKTNMYQWKYITRLGYNYITDDILSPLHAVEIRHSIHKETTLRSFAANGELSGYRNDVNTDAPNALLLRGWVRVARKYQPKKEVALRIFGGKFLYKDGHSPIFIGLSGSPDYLKQSVYLDRAQISPISRGFIRQTDEKDGAFKNFIPLYSSNWMTTASLEADLPATFLSVYGDLGLSSGYNGLLYGAGFYVKLIKNYFRIYLPVAGTKFQNSIPESFNDFKSNIR